MKHGKLLALFAACVCATTSLAEGEFRAEIGGVGIVLPSGWESLEQPSNFFVQKRGRHPDQGIALSAGAFKLDLSVEQYVTIGVAGIALGPEASLDKIAMKVGVSKENVERAVASQIGRQLMDGIKKSSATMKFELLKVLREDISGAPRFEIHSKVTMPESGQTLYSRQFVLPGASPKEIVQITYVGTKEEILSQKDLASGLQHKAKTK